MNHTPNTASEQSNREQGVKLLAKIANIVNHAQIEEHPFGRASNGLQYFVRLVPVVHRLSHKELQTALVPSINELLRACVERWIYG